MKNLSLLDSKEVLLDDRERDCLVTYDRNFLSQSEASALFKTLDTEMPLVRETVVMYGRKIEVDRETCGVGEAGLRYRYSGVERVAAPWPPVLLPLLDALENHVGVRFNYALCQRYRSGEVGLGWHADNEKDIVRDSPIASLSLGAERDFQMRLGRSGGATLAVRLGHGSLLVMSGATQAHYQHQVPKRAATRSARINLTFRLLHAPDGRRGVDA